MMLATAYLPRQWNANLTATCASHARFRALSLFYYANMQTFTMPPYWVQTPFTSHDQTSNQFQPPPIQTSLAVMLS
jgi:hypothetical protein